MPTLMRFLRKKRGVTGAPYTTDIQPTQVVYNVPIIMNRKKVLNIALDKNISNSAATVKMISDLETKLDPYTKSNVDREIFEVP